MVWNIQIATWHAHTIPAHLVDQILPHHYDLLAAVLDSGEGKTKGL